MNRRFSLLILALIAIPAAAQQTPPATVEGVRADIAVPVAPALLAIDGDASKLLRPSSVAALSAALSTVGDGNSIPKAFAVEFSPLLLLKEKSLSLQDYRNNQNLARFRFSAAAKRVSEGDTKARLAVGLRWSTGNDRTDPRLSLRLDSLLNPNPARVLELMQFLTINNPNNSRDKWLTRCRVLGDMPRDPATLSAADKKLELSPAIDCVATTAAKERAALLKTFNDETASLPWQGPETQFGLAQSSAALDTLGRGLRADAYRLWVSQGISISDTNRVFLVFGAQMGTQRDSATAKWTGEQTFSARLFVGPHDRKLWFEGHRTIAANDAKSDWLALSGVDLRLGDGLWLNASLGWLAPSGNKGKVVVQWSLNKAAM